MSIEDAIEAMQPAPRITSRARSAQALASFSRQFIVAGDYGEAYWSQRINSDPDPSRTRVERTRRSINAAKDIVKQMRVEWAERLWLPLCQHELTMLQFKGLN